MNPTYPIKDQLLKAVRDLPGDASLEDAMEKMFLLFKIHKGLHQVESGKKISHEQAKKRMKKWLK